LGLVVSSLQLLRCKSRLVTRDDSFADPTASLAVYQPIHVGGNRAGTQNRPSFGAACLAH
jgi:hypothetical protein